MVSHRPNDENEYDAKRELYAKLGVLYYVVYNPEFWQRDRHQPFEVYTKLQGIANQDKWSPMIGMGGGGVCRLGTSLRG